MLSLLFPFLYTHTSPQISPILSMQRKNGEGYINLHFSCPYLFMQSQSTCSLKSTSFLILNVVSCAFSVVSPLVTQSVFSIPFGALALPHEGSPLSDVAHQPHCRWWPCSEHPCALQGCLVLVLSKPSDGTQVARVILVPKLEQRHYTTKQRHCLEMKMPYM